MKNLQNLKILIICNSIFYIFICNSFSQNCESYALSKASSIEYLINGTSNLKYSIKKDGDKIMSIYSAGGKDYISYTKCHNDTLYLYKGDSPQYIINGTDTSGVSYYGVCKIPFKLKVGDSLYSYAEVTINSFTTSEKKEAYNTSSYVLGNYRYTTAILHSDIVNSTFGMGIWTLNYVNAVVSAQEKVSFQGKEFNAFKISSEIWRRTNLTYSASSNDKFLDKKSAKVAKKMNKKSKKITDKMADNEQGYMVTPVDQWFVPELGTFVKSIFYNSQKILITTKVELISIQ